MLQTFRNVFKPPVATIAMSMKYIFLFDNSKLSSARITCLQPVSSINAGLIMNCMLMFSKLLLRAWTSTS